MLYRKNNAPKLSEELFLSPTAEYRAAPFWAWNGTLEKEQLMQQIDCLKRMGMGGFHIHSRTGLNTPYMGDAFMEMVRACCDKAEDNQLLTWLYDEDRWSSGSAGGKVTRNTKFRRKRLNLFPEDKGWNTPKETALETGEPYWVACYDVETDADGFLTRSVRINRDDTAVGTKWYAYVMNEKASGWFNGNTYVDALDAEAIRTFIDLTHERYWKTVGDRFGNSIPGIFTDEPNASHERHCTIPTPDYRGRILYGWSRFFEELFCDHYGWDILDRLPELFWICRDRSDSQVKYCYFDFVAHLFSQNYCKQLGDWCDGHGIALTGHLMREPKLEEQAITCGEAMRCYGSFGIPGMDILCDSVELTTAKQVQSAIHQYGKEAMMSELYGVTNWDFDFRGHKFQGDWQAALGVTVRVPHLTWMTMAGEAKRDYPAAIGYQSPWHSEYAILEDHFARINTALTRGHPIVRVAVIHPMESYWISSGPNSQMSAKVDALEESFRNVSQWLIEAHLDYDYLCESQIPVLTSGRDPREVGQMRYDAIVVAGCITLRRTTLEYLEHFRKAGGSVVFAGECPSFVDGKCSERCRQLYENSIRVSLDRAALTAALEPVREISLRLENGREADELLYNYRLDGDGRWLFIAHGKKRVEGRYSVASQYDVVSPDHVRISVDGIFRPVKYNTMDGTIEPIPCRYESGATLVDCVLHPLDSLLLKLEPGEGTFRSCPVTTKFNELSYSVKHPVPYSCSEPNVLLLDLAEFAFDEGPWQTKEDVLRIDNQFRDLLHYPKRNGKNPQPYMLADEARDHILHLRYTFESKMTVSDALIALEDASSVVIHLNGASCASEITGFFTDTAIQTRKLPDILPGKNELCLDIPFGRQTNVEWVYILGNFGVQVRGCECMLIPREQTIGFGDITIQGMPFYGGNLTYTLELEVPEKSALKLRVPYYRGALVGVSLDGIRKGSIILPPYECIVRDIPAGRHQLELTVFGNRHNSFGALHMVNSSVRWFGPAAWRTEGDDWCYEYRLKPFGILKSPDITLLTSSI